MVVLVFCYKGTGSNPTEVYSFLFYNLFENNEHKQKEAGDGELNSLPKIIIFNLVYDTKINLADFYSSLLLF